MKPRPTELDAVVAGAAKGRRAAAGTDSDVWRTALTCIEPNKILVRGYALDEIMGRLSFGEAIYLLLVGEIPSPAMGRLMEALLVSFIDHGATPPSTLAARNTATTGAPLRACVAAGVLGFGRYHGGDIESCMQWLDAGLAHGPGGHAACARRQRAIVDKTPRGGRNAARVRAPVPHARSAGRRLFQMALELEVEAEHIQMIRAVEMVLHDQPDEHGRTLPVNIDGAIAAVCGDLGHSADHRRRAVHHLARAGHRRPRRRGTPAAAADASDRPEGPQLRRAERAPHPRAAEVGRARLNCGSRLGYTWGSACQVGRLAQR